MDSPLPPLRDELQLLEAAVDGDGQGGFLIFDPVQHKYFRIGLTAAKALSTWTGATGVSGAARVPSATGATSTSGVGCTVGALIARLKQQGVLLGLDEVGALVQFVVGNCLAVSGQGEAKKFVESHEKTRQNLLMQGLHNYLFFKIPLLRPQRFLNAAFPYVSWLGSGVMIKTIMVLTLLGVFLTARQFEVFVHSFADFANWQGAVLLAVTLVMLKTAHELGHAFVATRYKCQVPVMGVAFMVMLPMLYSEISDAWKLKNKRQRLMIDGAGMMTEMALGGICLFLWALLPDGPLRTVCFFVATTGWIMSVVVNLSPFMRFDGYHILADSLGVHNLQARGFALGKWQLRKTLFGLGDKVPEVFSPRLHRLLVAYAWGTWIYRLVLFFGIALMVYFLFFKLLGIVLFVVEIVWFIALPVYREALLWWQRRSDIKQQQRAFLSLFLLMTVVVLLFLPLSRSVNIPAVIGAGRQAQYYAPVAAQVSEIMVRPGAFVKAGDVLAVLSSPVYKEAQLRARLKLALVEKRLARGGANAQERALRVVLEGEKDALLGELQGLAAKATELTLRAGIDGVVSEVANDLHKGMWVNQDLRLMHVVAKDQGFEGRGLVYETDVERLSRGDKGVFISENAGPVKLDVVVEKISAGLGGYAQGRELAYLSDQNNGPISMKKNREGEIRPSKAVYRVLFIGRSDEHQGWLHEQRGTIVVKARAQSVMGRFFRHAVSVILRESGF